MNWIKKPKKTNLTKWIGLLLITAALIIWLHSIIEIKSNEIMLANQNLSIEEVWAYEGALQWWKNAYVTAILPTTGILTISGIATLITPQLFGFAQKITLKKPELTLVEEKAVSRNDNVKEEPILVLQNLISEEANLKEEKKKLASFMKKLQLKIEE